jgi:Flp pilus assembly protein TadD
VVATRLQGGRLQGSVFLFGGVGMSLGADVAVESGPTAAGTGTRISRRWAELLIILAGVIIYLDSFQGAFVYDEIDLITNNPTIRRLWPPWTTMLAPINVNRPLIALADAINYAISGLNPWSYHAVNLIIHVAAALALFGILRRTLESERMAASFGRNSTGLSLVIALIWMVHPLQTESVTYVMQRCESLMGMFYLVTLYCAIRSLSSRKKLVWYAAAVAACCCGMMSKEVMVTAPILVVLYDVSFGAGSVKGLLRRRWPLYLGLAATWGVLAATMMAAPASDTAGFAVKSVSSWDYCKSEFAVIVYYLRLSFWPSPLCIDYSDWPQARGAAQIIPYAVADGALVAASIWAVLRRRPAGFAGISFFVILSVTSTIMPISDLVFEHRMYLPLAPLVALVVLTSCRVGRGVVEWLPATPVLEGKRIGLMVATIVVVILGFATARRNIDYKSSLTMWRDVVDKRPNNARAHNNLGQILGERDDLDGARAEFYEAVRLNPNSYEEQFNLGSALAKTGNFKEAEGHMIRAVRLKPEKLEAHFALGTILTVLGEMKGSIDEFGIVVKGKPDSVEAHRRLGVALEREGRIAEAKEQYDAVLRLQPDSPGLRDHIGELQ